MKQRHGKLILVTEIMHFLFDNAVEIFKFSQSNLCYFKSNMLDLIM